MKFTTQLRQENNSVWQQIFDCPFITGLTDGTLAPEAFRYYFIQDNKYCVAFYDLHQKIAAKMTNRAHADSLAHLVDVCNEISEHSPIYDELNLTQTEIDSVPVAPTAYAYITNMNYQFEQQGIDAGEASLVPCYWTYTEMFRKIAEKGFNTKPVYKDFIDFCASEEFGSVNQQMLNLTDDLAENTDDKGREKMRLAFQYSSEYELQYWNMCVIHEQWLLDQEQEKVARPLR
ncbi:TenA family protein [Lentilactobacillus sp. TOM.63]|uniref:TenA family protein n=1 Tax=Lentilactobacillus sp. TOM.63 TaxID=3055077 RepID=UPI0025A2FEF6|nr:TenA family protein [Lentilactobacillus sp. TOM.63]MDM7517603.1 TenA family protein [Lentilactobacillus sp. TOM.63]